MSSARTSWSVQVRIERTNERLHDACGTVDGPQVGPRFQVVRLRDVPGRKRRGFVGIASDMETERGFSSMLGKFQIGRRVVAGIGPDHDELVDDAGIEVRAPVRTNCRRRGRPAVRSTGSIRSTGACKWALIQCTSAFVSGESDRPARTSPLPRFADRSAAACFAKRMALSGSDRLPNRRAHRAGDRDRQFADQGGCSAIR